MQFRYARHTNQLNELENFYTSVLGFKKLVEFKDHDGYDGVFLGIEGLDWHIEFTQTNEKIVRDFDEDDLLVLYPENQSLFDDLILSIKNNDISFHQPKNPYWKENGFLIQDPDGYGIIISPIKI